MTPGGRRLGPGPALLLLAGCDSNPEGPRDAPHTSIEGRPRPDRPGEAREATGHEAEDHAPRLKRPRPD